MIAAAGALLVAALLPLGFPRWAGTGRVLAALGALTLLPAAGSSGTWPVVLLAGGAAALGTPLPLVLAAAGAIVVSLRPEASAPIAAALAGLAVAAAADSLTSGARARRASGAIGPEPVLVAGLFLVLVLLLGDGGAVLSWSFGVEAEAGRAVLPGAGVGLGLALLAALGGLLLHGGAAVAGESAAEARRFGALALWAALAAASVGVVTAFVRAGGLESPLTREGVVSLGVLLAAVGALAVTLLERPAPTAEDAAVWTRRGDLGTQVAAGLAVAAAVAAGVESWWREGTYATDLTAAAGAAALLGLAALEPGTRLAGTRRLLLLGALLYLLLA